jgi:hypothetical protein
VPEEKTALRATEEEAKEVAEKTYRPKKAYEGLKTLSAALADRDEPLHVESFPYATDDAAEQGFLDSHPMLTDRPDSSASSEQASGEAGPGGKGGK